MAIEGRSRPIRVWNGIFAAVARKFLAMEFEGTPPGIILRSIDFKNLVTGEIDKQNARRDNRNFIGALCFGLCHAARERDHRCPASTRQFERVTS
jgi:hypothetical protein